MTEKQARVRLAEIDAEEQAVTVDISKMRERLAKLETTREFVRQRRAEAWLVFVSAQEQQP